MELERWAQLSAAVSAVAADFGRHPRDTYSTATIVRVHLWAALFDRPTRWVCRAVNWKPCTRPAELPDQSTMSRRTRRDDFELFLEQVGKRLGGKAAPGLVRVVDGKPLELPNHTTDRDATWGRGVSRTSVGYKFHAVFSGGAMPDAFAVTTLAVSEKDMAARMVGRLGGHGYLLADAHFDASWLFDYCRHHGFQLVCPRAKPGTGTGHHYVSPHRLRAIRMLEPPKHTSWENCRSMSVRRPDHAPALGPKDLAGPELGHGQAPDQRRPRPPEQKSRTQCIILRSTGRGGKTLDSRTPHSPIGPMYSVATTMSSNQTLLT